MTVVRVWLGCLVCAETHWGRTERLEWKERPVYHKHTKHVSLKIWTNISVHQKYSLKWIKNTLAKSTTVSEHSCQDDRSPWLHTFNTTCLQASGYERAETCCVCTRITKTWIPHDSQVKKNKNFVIDILPTHERGYIKKQNRKTS